MFSTDALVGAKLGETEGSLHMVVVDIAQDVLRRGEAAKRLGVHANTLTSWASRGWIETVKLPSGEARYRAEDVESLRRRIYGDDNA